MASTEVRVERVSHGIANFYIVEEARRVLLIDAGVSGDWSLLIRALAARGLDPSGLAAILLTHAHSDHTGFAERARSERGTPVWVHSDDAEVARGSPPHAQEARLRGYLGHLEAWRTLFGLLAHGGARIVPIREVGTFSDGQILDLPGRPRVIHLPGHTAGMSGVFLPSAGALFTGDALVTRNPLTGRRGPQIMPRGLNVDSTVAMASLAKIESLPATAIYPGHGEPWSGSAEAAVQSARTAGHS